MAKYTLLLSVYFADAANFNSAATSLRAGAQAAAEAKAAAEKAKREKTSKWDWAALSDFGNTKLVIDAEHRRDSQFSEAACRSHYSGAKSADAKLAKACDVVCKKLKDVKDYWGMGGTGPYACATMGDFGCVYAKGSTSVSFKDLGCSPGSPATKSREKSIAV
mmetsp:Transcript_80774/g.125943  ORF Transcript_80774/g.125943 Transcript_80774/m.125943 type:complete len:163 (-) Transcript_80774:177-665(-)